MSRLHHMVSLYLPLPMRHSLSLALSFFPSLFLARAPRSLSLSLSRSLALALSCARSLVLSLTLTAREQVPNKIEELCRNIRLEIDSRVQVSILPTPPS